MKRVVYAEDVKELINGLCSLPWEHEIDYLVNSLPTVEAEPVVHCKDCRHWGMGVSGETDHVKCCEYGEYMVGMNGYCVYGAKKDGEWHESISLDGGVKNE
jgi:hypothetical protein